MGREMVDGLVRGRAHRVDLKIPRLIEILFPQWAASSEGKPAGFNHRNYSPDNLDWREHAMPMHLQLLWIEYLIRYQETLTEEIEFFHLVGSAADKSRKRRRE